MSNEAVPSEVRTFLAREVRSLVAMELLILLASNRSRRWAAAELSRELRATVEWVQGELPYLTERGLVQSTPSAEGVARYQFVQTNSPPGAEYALGWLAASYPALRFSIIQALYSLPGSAGPSTDSLQNFADAFKIRKEPPHG